MKPCLCDDCAKPMTVEEIHYYERRCETCEQAWSDRMGAWMRGETVEPELDAMFSVPRRGAGE
jgi:hypothetical protein